MLGNIRNRMGFLDRAMIGCRLLLTTAVIMALCAWSGCSGTPPPTLDFSLAIDRGVFSHDLLIRSNNTTIDNAEITITTILEDGTRPQLKRFWETWESGEVKKVNIPAGNLQIVRMSGRGHVGSAMRHIECGWSAIRTTEQQ